MKFNINVSHEGISLDVEGTHKEDTARTLAVANLCLNILREHCPRGVVRAAEKIEKSHARKEKKEKRKERRNKDNE